MAASAFAPELAPLQAVVSATLAGDGRLLAGNAGFLRLLEPRAGPGARFDDFFIQPNLAALRAAPADDQGLCYSGLLTVGDPAGLTRTLRGRVWRDGEGLRLLAEFDIEELERVWARMLELNHDYAQAQLALAQANRTLQQREACLARMVDELTEANAGLKRAESQLVQSAKLAAIGSLAAGMAHEINNPIGFVRSNLGTLGEYIGDLLGLLDACATELAAGRLSGEQLAALSQRAGLDFIREDLAPLLGDSLVGLDRVRRIIQALRDFAGIDAVETRQPENIVAGLDSTLLVLAGELARCTVHVRLPPLPPVDCVISQLNQVFMHLLRNAAQAAGEGGTITLAGGSDEDAVWISVADDGPGIAPEHLGCIFDPFFTTRSPGHGMGLGLSVAYGIVDRLHGRIEVDSAPGQGAIFRICLPLRQS